MKYSLYRIQLSFLSLSSALLTCSLLLTNTVYATSLPIGISTVEYSLTELLGSEQANSFKKILPPNRVISWTIYIPTLSNLKPPSVLVYISPTKSGGLDSNWREVLEQHKMIYIAAESSGNNTLANQRMVMAIMAIKVLDLHLDYDRTKVFISGFSGGGRVASMLAIQYPSLFQGGLYICGVDFWKKSQSSKVARLLKNRFVFLTGNKDFNRKETRKVYRRYLGAGAENSSFMSINGMGHEHPDTESFRAAIEYLLNQTSREKNGEKVP